MPWRAPAYAIVHRSTCCCAVPLAVLQAHFKDSPEDLKRLNHLAIKKPKAARFKYMHYCMLVLQALRI